MEAKRRRTGTSERTPGVIITLSCPSKLQFATRSLLSLFDQVPKREIVEPELDDTANVSEQIAAELKDLRADSKCYRFSAELSRGVGLISFNKSLKPSEFVAEFLRCRLPSIPPPFVSRILPIDFVCAPNLQSFASVCVPYIAQKFSAFDSDRTWKLVLEKHGLTNLTKDNVIALLREAIEPRHEASISSPEIVVMVHAFPSMCGVGFLEDYENLAEYNVRKLIAKSNPS